MTGSTFDYDLRPLLAEEGYVRRLARALLFDEHRVDDVVQQTWLAALRHPPADRGAVRAWLAGVVRRLVANEVRGDMRRRRRECTAAPADETAPAVDEALAREERRHEVVAVLQGLAEPYRTAVALRYLEGATPAAIARRQGVPAATVRSRVRRGLEQMRERLDRRYGGDRAAWCAALLPLVRGRDTAVTLATGGALVALRLLVLGALGCVAAVTYALWPGGGAPAPVPPATVAVSPPGNRATPDAGPRSTAADQRASVARAENAAGPVAWPGGLRGRLLGPEGEPLAGARIDAFAFDGTRLFGHRVDLPSARVRTVADGTFELRGLPSWARCAMVADADGPLRQLVPLASSPEYGATVDVGDVRLQARAAIHGTVVGPDGKPVAGAEIWCADLPAFVLAAAPVGHLVPEHGALVMLPRPDAKALADAAAWSDAARNHLAWRLTATGYGELPSADYTPVVLDGTPLRPLWDRLPMARAVTDAQGRFRVTGVAPGANVLVARAGALAPTVRSGVMASTRRERSVGTIRMARGETLRGHVTGPGGEPVAGAEVRAAPIGLLGFRGIAPCEPAVVSDASGRFAISGLGRGRVVVAFRAAPDVPWQVRGPVETGDSVDLGVPALAPVELALRLPAGVEPAAVQWEGRPAPPLGELARLGCVARFHALKAECLPRRTVARLAPGLWTLRVSAPGCLPTARLVAVPAGAPVAFELRRSVELAVTVRDARGAPCAGAEVFAQIGGDPDERTVMASRFGLAAFSEPWPRVAVRTDEHGRARLATGGRKVRVSARHGALGGAEREVDTVAVHDVALRLSGTGSIEGELAVGPTLGGDPRAFRIVVERRWSAVAGGPVPAQASARPDAGGHFRFAGLPPGRYDVAVLDALPASLTLGGLVEFLDRGSSPMLGLPDQIESKSVVIAAGDIARVALAMGGLDRSRGGVRGRLSIEGVPAEGYTVWARERRREGTMTFDSGWELRARATVDRDGGFVVGDLAPRTWWLGLREGRKGAFMHVFEVDVRAGARAPVTADVQLGSLRGVVRRADGHPGQGVTVSVDLRSAPKMIERRVTTDGRGGFAFQRLPAGRYVLRASSRHLEIGDTEVDVLPGAASAPLDLTGATRYRLRLRLDQKRPGNDMVGFTFRRHGERRCSTYSTDRSEVELVLAQPGEYDLFLSIGGQMFAAVPPRVRIDQLDSVVDVGIGPPADIK